MKKQNKIKKIKKEKSLDVINVRKIAIGISDFKDMIEHDDLYVDKTMLIAEILNNRVGVQLFTRPRRFGKTTNIMMLKEFFDVTKKEENEHLFDGLNISETKYIDTHRGEHPVIFISFKDIKEANTDESMLEVRRLIARMYKEHSYLLKSLSEIERKNFENILWANTDGDYRGAIKNLSEYLYEYWGKKVIVLIDEYDTPLITAYVKDYYNEVIDFYRVFYGNSFKDNPYLEKAVITGINRIAKEGMFSGLNNLEVNSIFSKRMESYFGFTEEEIKEMLVEYELEDQFENVKKWYDGYKFNGVSIYNSWSIINYLRNREFGTYWINTSANSEINKFLSEVTNKTEGVKIFKELEKLAKGEEIITEINEYVLFKDLTTKEELWNLMLNAGYLTSTGEDKFGDCIARIPNYEIQKFFSNVFIVSFSTNKSKISKMIKILADGEIELFKEELSDYVLTSSSFMISDKEVFYQGFMLGLFMVLRDHYIANIEIEAGKGRADLILEAFDKKDMSYVIEMKVAKTQQEMKEMSSVALTQIKEKKYYNHLIERKTENITIIGITFFEKEVEIVNEIMKKNW